jgi:branched-chain amino acid transport system ATP-binding protein
MSERAERSADRLLQVENVSASYGDYQVLDGVSFEVGTEDIVVYLGRNGTGKTTTFKLVTGLMQPDAGTVNLDGEDVTGEESYRVARRGISFVTADNKVFPHLTVRENIRLPTLERDVAADFDALFELFPDLAAQEGTKAGNLSGGQQQMVALAQGLAPNPDLLLLDEPVQGLAVEFVEKVADLLDRLHGEVAVVMIEHDIDLALEVGDRALVLDEGRIAWQGSTDDLAANDEVIDRYIGVKGYA